MKKLTLKEAKVMFWSDFATEEEKKEYRTRKKQNDYSCDIRCKWVDFVDYLLKDGLISEKQADNFTL